MKVKTLIVTAMLLLAVNSLLLAQDAQKFAFKYEKGKSYLYRITTNSEQRIDAMGQEMVNTSFSRAVMRMEVTDVLSDKFEILSSFDSVYVKSNTPQGENINNGEKIVGKKIKVYFNQIGKKIENIEIDKIERTPGFDLSRLESSFARLPEKELKIGDKWSVTDSSTTEQEGGKTKSVFTAEYTFGSTETVNGDIIAKINAVTTTKVNGHTVQMQNEIDLDGKSKVTGVIFFNITKGVVVSSESTSLMDMNAVMAEQGVTIPITTETKTKVVLL